MKTSTRPRTTVDHEARRYYVIFCAVSTALIAAVVTVVSLYLA